MRTRVRRKLQTFEEAFSATKAPIEVNVVEVAFKKYLSHDLLTHPAITHALAERQLSEVSKIARRHVF